ncbi:hypothetical protein EYF80_038476 [Liparis tanakae]|uniref:Uncharacterized protein n=1 Tax=Liparis tanakae TaxID=230148 RepID=A0A4Z2GF76_9TELE|nr:hypothetical protein EYF80_038476 [Liparis tanakae]
MASAPLAASSAETHAVTGPLAERQNLSTPCLVRLHTRTCDGGTVQQKSDEQSLNSQLNRLNLRFELGPLLYGHRGSYDGAGHPAGPAQGLLGADKHLDACCTRSKMVLESVASASG